MAASRTLRSGSAARRRSTGRRADDGGGTRGVLADLGPGRFRHAREERGRGGRVETRQGQDGVRAHLPAMVGGPARHRGDGEPAERGRGRGPVGAPAPERIYRGEDYVWLAVSGPGQDGGAVGRIGAQARRGNRLHAHDHARVGQCPADELLPERGRQRTRACGGSSVGPRHRDRRRRGPRWRCRGRPPRPRSPEPAGARPESGAVTRRGP